MKKFYPQKAANDITVVLRAAGVDQYPVNVEMIAREISAKKFPDDPIAVIKGDNLPGFEGALSPPPAGRKGWGIFYNNAMSSKGRVNFTLGHEFGHYLLHRNEYPKGFQCSTEDMATWESEYGQRENEANIFAATLLMPLDDFRAQVGDNARPDFEALGHCADRYDVSLIASTLRWLQLTRRRSIFVVSRDGFILWARSSSAAMKSRLFFRTRNVPPVPIPKKSLAASLRDESRGVLELAASDGWLNQGCTEHTILSEQYDFTMSLLHFGDAEYTNYEQDEAETETLDQVIRKL